MIIKVDGVSAGYGTKQKILKEINFTLQQGHILGVLGRNGCGKTTLFRCLCGLLPISSGSIRVMNNDIVSLSRKEMANIVAVVPQATSTVFSLPVMDMILLGAGCKLRAWQTPDEKYIAEAEKHAEELHISHLLDKQFNKISGGEQQLVLIGRALMQNTNIILMDEPTSHLDFYNKYLIMDMVKSLSENYGNTIIITAHDPNIALDYCTDVLMIKDGWVMAQGLMIETMNEENLSQLYGKQVSIQATQHGKVVVPIK